MSHLEDISLENKEVEFQVENIERECSRLELYSDAVFSILATISILPAMEALKEEENLSVDEMTLIIIGYFVTYLIILFLYRHHMAMFNRVFQLSVLLYALNTIHIAFIACYPFLNSMVFLYPSYHIPVYLHATLFAWVSLSSAILTLVIGKTTTTPLYTFNSYVRIIKDPNSIWNLVVGLIISVICSLSVAVIVFVIGIYYPPAALTGYVCIIPIYKLGNMLLRVIDQTKKFDGQPFEKSEKKKLAKAYQKYFPKERIIAFTDGIFAISITLTVVNLRSPVLEDSEDESEEEYESSFNEALLNMWPQYISYSFSFLIVGLFWFWHHRLLSVVTRVPSGLYFINIIFLSLVATLPASSELVGVYFTKDGVESSTALLGASIVNCSITLIVMWFYLTKISKKSIDPNNPLLRPKNRNLIYIGLSIIALSGLFCLAISWIGEHGAHIGFFSLFLIPVYTLIFLAIIGTRARAVDDERKFLISDFNNHDSSNDLSMKSIHSLQ